MDEDKCFRCESTTDLIKCRIKSGEAVSLSGQARNGFKKNCHNQDPKFICRVCLKGWHDKKADDCKGPLAICTKFDKPKEHDRYAFTYKAKPDMRYIVAFIVDELTEEQVKQVYDFYYLKMKIAYVFAKGYGIEFEKPLSRKYYMKQHRSQHLDKYGNEKI